MGFSMLGDDLARTTTETAQWQLWSMRRGCMSARGVGDKTFIEREHDDRGYMYLNTQDTFYLSTSLNPNTLRIQECQSVFKWKLWHEQGYWIVRLNRIQVSPLQKHQMFKRNFLRALVQHYSRLCYARQTLKPAHTSSQLREVVSTDISLLI